MKYYNAEGYEVERYQEAIIKYQVKMLAGGLLRAVAWPRGTGRAERDRIGL